MKGWKKIIIFALSGVIICTVCVAESFLVPQKFPQTFNDLDFVSRMEVKAEGYDRYATLSPYEKLVLEAADDGIEEQIAQDLADAEQTPSQQPNQNTSTNETSPGSQTTPPIATSGEYCKNRHNGIPANQNIPFGSPVLHEHFVYCSPYGNLDRGSGSRPHIGYDIGCTSESFGRPVFATADGVVTTVMPNRKGKSAGNYVIVDHGNGFQTWYLHLDQIHVTKGQRVSAGCQIGSIGNTGGSLESIKGDHSDLPHFDKKISHLHYEIHYTGSLTSVTTSTGKTLAIKHGWPNINKQNTRTSIDPTQFICVYAHFGVGGCKM